MDRGGRERILIGSVISLRSSDFLGAFDGLCRLRRRAAHRALRATLGATVLSQVSNQPIHCREIGGVKQLPTFATPRDQPRALQTLQMESERGRYEAYPFGNESRRQARRSALDEQPEDRQPMFVCQRAQGFDDLRRLHEHTIFRLMS